ncbi:MAG: ABC transporter permease [Candidatus Izemoplasma sp.]|nr:ABC transporter permease [Candidatus Izemoplasma sp.]
MGRYILIRSVFIFIVIFIVLSLNFTILKLAPQYPPTTEDARTIYFTRQVNDGYMTSTIVDDPFEVAEIENGEWEECANNEWYCEKVDDIGDSTFYRIYKPIPLSTQFFTWIKNIITDWNWGYSTRVAVNVPVFDVLKTRLPVTIRLNIISLFFYIPVGFALGIIAALNKNSLIDNIISLGVMIFISVPSFVVMTLLVMFFGYELGWFPAQFPSSDLGGAIQFWGMFLPVFGLSFAAVASLTRVSRAELTEVLTSEFLLLARTKGLTRRQAVIRHAMRNSMVPLVPGIIFSFVGLLSGSVIIERIYGIPGAGKLYLQALVKNNYDYNLLLGLTAFYTIISLFAVLIVDLSYGLVDPRIRMGARK